MKKKNIFICFGIAFFTMILIILELLLNSDGETAKKQNRLVDRDIHADAIAVSLDTNVSLSKKEKNVHLVDMQIRIQELINKEVVPLRDVSSLDNYLQTLRERAIDQRDVTALEVETGIQAIQNLGTELGPEETQKREEQFTSEMEELSRQLGKVPQPREKISVEEAEQMIEVLSAETEPVRKSEIIREILNNIETIEDPEQEEKILKKLDFVIVNSENTKSSQNINEILDIIENASNAESRDVAVSAYVEAVSSLDEPDYGEAIEKLDRLLKK